MDYKITGNFQIREIADYRSAKKNINNCTRKTFFTILNVTQYLKPANINNLKVLPISFLTKIKPKN
jgi:hypothetical protein